MSTYVHESMYEHYPHHYLHNHVYRGQQIGEEITNNKCDYNIIAEISDDD